MENIAVQEGIKAHGRYRLIEADPKLAPEEYKDLLVFLRNFPLDIFEAEKKWGPHRETIYRRKLNAYHAKAKVAEHVFDNLVPTVGRSVIAQRLAGTTTYTGTLNYAAVGSGTTTPTNGDTTLGTEVYRQALSSQTYVNNIAYLSAFIAAGSATGTHTEGGLFIDGTGSANTGQIFSHVLFSPSIVKSALNSLTLDVTITVS